MRFSRGTPLNTNYFFGSNELEAVDSYKDLGLLMDQRLNFRKHILMVVSKAYTALGFMKRWSKEFNDPLVTKTLYTSLVRPNLEYGSVVWDPYYAIFKNMIESVQKQFLLFCLRGRYQSLRNLVMIHFLKLNSTFLDIGTYRISKSGQ
ncbi:uncharacterized protein LOC142231436 [Haematobia irritans]|uniref:uncharacterized protein LOC142231436 n=1 Tax=Haematobia irritans TaxID=7368 RepID=UPI003F50C07E